MSFSFYVRAASKDEAFTKARDEMDKVVQQQPPHAHDATHVMSTVETYLLLLPPDIGERDVQLNVNGSLGWQDEAEHRVFTSANIGVGVSLVPKEQASAAQSPT